MIKIADRQKWERGRKLWWNIYYIHRGERELIAKVASKGLAYRVAEEFAKIYEAVEIV